MPWTTPIRRSCLAGPLARAGTSRLSSPSGSAVTPLFPTSPPSTSPLTAGSESEGVRAVTPLEHTRSPNILPPWKAPLMMLADHFNVLLTGTVNLPQWKLDKLDERVDAIYGALEADDE